MDGEQNGTQAQRGTQQQEQQATQQQADQQEAQGKHAKETAADAPAGGGVDAKAYEKQLAERDSRIEELEAQIAEASKNAETADGLRAEIAALKQQGADERVEFSLMLAGRRNVKAAKAVLGDHGGDVDALKEPEPWTASHKLQLLKGAQRGGDASRHGSPVTTSRASLTTDLRIRKSVGANSWQMPQNHASKNEI